MLHSILAFCLALCVFIIPLLAYKALKDLRQ